MNYYFFFTFIRSFYPCIIFCYYFSKLLQAAQTHTYSDNKCFKLHQESRGVPSLFVFWKFFSSKYSLLARLRVDLLRGPRFPTYLGLRDSFY